MLKVARYTIWFFLALVSVSVFSLFSGIKVDSFSLGNISISQLYIKLDKKLILEAKDLVFDIGPSSDKKMTSEDIQKKFLQIPKILDFFEKIDIKHLKVKDNEFTILINDREIYIDNKDINLSSALNFNGSEFTMEIYSFYVKNLGLTLFGTSKVDVSKKIVNFFGEYDYLDIAGELNIQSTEDILDFYINSKKDIKSLKFLKKFFRLPTVAEAWMYDNVEGDISLNYLYGKVDLNEKKPLLNSIKGQAVIRDAKIRFHKDAEVVNTKKLKINYENDTLSFNLQNPIYNNSSKIYGSKVYINHLTSREKGTVNVALKSDSRLNDDVHGILKAYNIVLPLKQIDGQLDSSLILRIPYTSSRKMIIDGLFKIKEANLELDNFKFLAKKATVVLKNRDVYIKDAHLIHGKMLDTNLELDLDTKSLTATGKASINAFEIKHGDDTLTKINDFNTNLELDFNNGTNIYLDALKTAINVEEENIAVDIEDLSLVYPYSKLLKTIDIKDGDLKINYVSEDNISFNTNLKNLDFPLKKNEQKITTLSAKGFVKGEKTNIISDDSSIEVILNKGKTTLLKLKDIDVVLEDNEEEKKKKEFPSIDIELKDSSIALGGSGKYHLKWAKVQTNNSKIDFEGEVHSLDLPISKNTKELTSLNLIGSYTNDILDIHSRDRKLNLKYNLVSKSISAQLNGYDIVYDIKKEPSGELLSSLDIVGLNSNIIINKKHIVKATSYRFKLEDKKTNIDLQYKDTAFIYTKDSNGNIVINGTNMNDTFINALANKEIISDGHVNLSAKGKDDLINGSIKIENTKIKDLAVLNNLLIFINTSPGLINPLFAVPSVVGMAANEGFNLTGYKIIEGDVEFTYNFADKFLNLNRIFTKGNGIDFEGYALVDFESSKIDSTLKVIFFKSYSKIVGSIPVINYLFLGDEKRVDTQVKILGTLEDPKYETSLVKEGIQAPVNFLKRIITSPKKLFESNDE